MRRRLHLPTWLRLSRYTIGSVICFGISEVVFVGLFGSDLLGSRGAAIVASIAGIIPGYFLNRSWTWGRRGASDFWREIVPYWATALLSTLIAAIGTGAANAWFIAEPRATRTMINAAAYMLIYGVLFLAKYVIFQKWLFAPPAPADDGAPIPDPRSASATAAAAADERQIRLQDRRGRRAAATAGRQPLGSSRSKRRRSLQEMSTPRSSPPADFCAAPSGASTL